MTLWRSHAAGSRVIDTSRTIPCLHALCSFTAALSTVARLKEVPGCEGRPGGVRHRSLHRCCRSAGGRGASKGGGGAAPPHQGRVPAPARRPRGGRRAAGGDWLSGRREAQRGGAGPACCPCVRSPAGRRGDSYLAAVRGRALRLSSACRALPPPSSATQPPPASPWARRRRSRFARAWPSGGSSSTTPTAASSWGARPRAGVSAGRAAACGDAGPRGPVTVRAVTAGTAAAARLKIARPRGGGGAAGRGRWGRGQRRVPSWLTLALPPQYANAASGPAGSSPREPRRGAGAWGGSAGRRDGLPPPPRLRAPRSRNEWERGASRGSEAAKRESFRAAFCSAGGWTAVARLRAKSVPARGCRAPRFP